MSALDEVELEAKRIAYEMAADMQADAEAEFGEGVEFRLGPRSIGEIAKAVNLAGLGRMYSKVTVSRWLNDPDVHSPWIDWVAIERALDFDQLVIERLTPLERRQFYTALADMDDPYDQEASEHTIRRQAGEGSPGYDMDTPRRKSWQALPDLSRQAIQKGVARARRSQRSQAA